MEKPGGFGKEKKQKPTAKRESPAEGPNLDWMKDPERNSEEKIEAWKKQFPDD